MNNSICGSDKMPKTLEELIREADDIFNTDIRLKKFNSKPIYEKALKQAKNENNEFKMEFIQGRLAILNNNWEKALNHFDRTLEIDPCFLEGYNNKGLILSELHEYEESLESFNKALKINPEYYKGWNNRSFILSHMKKYEEAWESCERALEINPNFDSAWITAGSVLIRLGNYKKALLFFDKALKLSPDHDIAWNNKGAAFLYMKNYEEALKCFEKSLDINPKSDVACANKGRILSKFGKHEEALNCIDKCLQISPKSTILRFSKNSILMNIRKYEEVQEEREKFYSEEKEDIKKSKLSKEKKDEKILEINVQEEVIKELKDDYRTIFDAKNQNEKKLASSLEPRNNPIQDNFLMVLRRWNSYTPTIPTGIDSNLGGGYFIRWCGKGIVLDPGFDFLDNFFDNGLVIDDIDAVIITHAHIDYCVDFESLLTLIFEYNEKNDKKKKIDVFMNLGTIKKFLGWISLDEEGDNAKIKHIYPLEKGVSYSPEGYNLKITATDAVHNEILSKTYSVGIILDLYGVGDYTKSKPFKIGYTSDTGHSGHIEKQYEDVNIIISHLGSIEEDDFNPASCDAEGNIADTEGNHLMLKGVISTIYKSKANLAIVSEFGEELGEHRKTIVKALNKVFLSKGMTRCFTGDIGLKIKIPDLKVKCCLCEKFVAFNHINEGIENKEKRYFLFL